MSDSSKVSISPFSGVRIEVAVPHGPSHVLTLLRKYCGKASDTELALLAGTSGSAQEFANMVQERFVGTSGFMLFSQFDHTEWLAVYGIKRQVIRVILGNPLIAITMMKHDLRSGLFAPVEILLVESEDGASTNLVYVRPSSLISINKEEELLQSARKLDERLSQLVDLVCSERHPSMY